LSKLKQDSVYRIVSVDNEPRRVSLILHLSFIALS